MLEGETVTNAIVMDKGNLGINENIRTSTGIFYKRNQIIDIFKNQLKTSIIEPTENDALRIAGDRYKFHYAILTWEGNFVSSPHYHEACLEHINFLNKQTNERWLISAELFYDSEKKRSCIGHSTAIVNLKTWRQMDRPPWGKEEIAQVEEIIYTDIPRSIKSTTKRHISKVKKGWFIVNEALKAGLEVHDLSPEIYSAQTYLYPERDPLIYNKFWEGIFNLPKITGPYERVFEKIISSKFSIRIDAETWGYFVKNTENYFPSYKEEPMPWSDIHCLILPSSGFKDFVVAMSSKQNQARHHIQVIHYDILTECVSIKKEINERWDGTRNGLVNLLVEINQKYSDTGRKSNVFHMNGVDDYNEVYDDILEQFTSEDDLTAAWKEFQTYDHDYITVDMFEQESLNKIGKMIKGENIYLCLSDIAGWRNNMVCHGYKNLRRNVFDIVKSFNDQNFEGMVDYKDPGSDGHHLEKIEYCLYNMLHGEVKIKSDDGVILND